MNLWERLQCWVRHHQAMRDPVSFHRSQQFSLSCGVPCKPRGTQVHMSVNNCNCRHPAFCFYTYIVHIVYGAYDISIKTKGREVKDLGRRLCVDECHSSPRAL